MRSTAILGLLALLMLAVPVHAQDSPFVGQIDIVGFNFAPVGWMICEGQLLPISEYETLFNLIGTTYGGDGQSTFALPDLRGRMAIHQGFNGVSGYVIGQQGGEETVTLTLNQIPTHTHAAMGSSAAASTLGPGSSGGSEWATTTTYLYSSGGPSLSNSAVTSGAMEGGTIGSTGGGQPHENRPPFLVVNFIISLFGVYPSQS
jgi:microcystin-dependent protein